MRFIEKTIGQVLDMRAECTPNKPALVVEDGIYTWKDIRNIVNCICGEMLEMGIKKGDHVGIIGINSDSWIFHYFAAVKLGAVAVLFNTRFTRAEIERCVALTELRHFYYSRNFEDIRYEDIMEQLLYPKSTVRSCCFMEKTYEQWQTIAKEGESIDIKPSED